MSQGSPNNDRKTMLIVVAVAISVIVGAALLAPADEDSDPRPSTFNTGRAGAKAALLLLQQMGRKADRWERPLNELDHIDATRTTLVLADPLYTELNRKQLREQVQSFLSRGGRVLATGTSGARLLPGGETKDAKAQPLQTGPDSDGLCYTTPNGPGPLAKAGEIAIQEDDRWSAEGPQFVVEQWCSSDAVVVHYDFGKGEAIWWTSASPLTNSSLRRDPELRLLLASVGEGRDVLFDEALLKPTISTKDVLHGLPLWWLFVQVAIVAGLLIFSFSRRSGPTRLPVRRLRSSPVEFAESMGDLYEKAGAHVAATEAAKRRLLRIVVREGGVSRTALEHGPDAVAEALEHRLGGDWKHVADNLREVAHAESEGIAPRRALVLVRLLTTDADDVRRALRK